MFLIAVIISASFLRLQRYALFYELQHKDLAIKIAGEFD